MNILAPSILSADFTILGQQIKETEAAGAQYLHFDVMDGIFVPSISFGLPVLKSIRKASKQVYDVHLMIEEPIRYIEQFAESGADIITFHVEAASDSREVIDKIRSLGKKVGLAIKPKTPVEAVVPYLEHIDMLLVMTVEPGFGGQSFMPETVDKIRKIRERVSSLGIEADIEVDGGINDKTASIVLNAGANVLVSGSYLFKSDDMKAAAAVLREGKSC